MVKCKETKCLENVYGSDYCEKHRAENQLLGGCCLFFMVILTIAFLAATYKFVMWCVS